MRANLPPASTAICLSKTAIRQQEVDAKINAAFQQLFHGDPDTQAVYFSAGTNANGPLAYIKDVGSNDVRSEGMSYGMMIAVQLDKKAEFDAIWNWARTFMYHDSTNSPAYGYFSWSMKTNGKPNDEMPRARRRTIFCDVALFRVRPLGQRHGHLQLSRRSRPVADRYETSPDDHRCDNRRDQDGGRLV